MKQMKNIKTPAYELKLGKGFFAGANWQCIKCGYIINNYTSTPVVSGCKVTGGNHIFQKM